MGHKQKIVVVVSFILLLVVSNRTAGGEIYHWVDEDGVMYFSDWAPYPSVSGVSRLTVANTNPPDYDPREDRSSINSQAERTTARWTEIKARRDERRNQRLEAEERAWRLAIPAYEPEEYYVSPVWYGPLHPIRLINHHRPKVKFHRHHALDKLGLRHGRRPHSINSSAHLARITASREVLHGMRPKHGMRQPGDPVPRRRPIPRDRE